ncbi:MAG TPA: aspartate ammonia-lyase, partial [Arthrobacter sp.]|nr:aspartate ammonia-lyase [Arthrobacter sp.]
MTETQTLPDASPLSGLRSEHDLLGDRDIPAGAYWGVHTLRAVENFPITG